MIEVPCLVSFNEHPGFLTQIIYKGLSYIKSGWGERSIFLRTWLSGSVCQLLQPAFLAMDDRSRRFRIDSLLDMASFVSFLCPWVEWAFQISQLFGRRRTSTYLFFFFLCVPFKENAYNQVIFVSPPVKLLKCQEELLAMGTDSILIWPESNLLFTGLHAGVQ